MSVCAIIGAGPGIGAALARRFSKAGMQVALLSRKDASALAEAVSAEGGEARWFSCDAERSTSIVDALGAVERAFGAIDVLCYNAATVRPGAPFAVGAEQLVRELRVDVVGFLVAAQKVAPHMLERRAGSILVTGGGLALEPWPQMTALSVGKAGVRSLALLLHKELAPQGVHAATVTVCGIVEKGGRFDPDRIADVFFELHQQAPGAFEAERVLR